MLYVMRWSGLAVVSCAALLLTAMDEAAAGGRGSGSGRSFSFSGGSRVGHSGSQFHHGAHFHSRVFVGVGVGAPLFWGPAYYYPPDYYYAPGYYYPPPSPAYIEQSPAPAEQGSQYWYYCPSARAYYPYVDGCPEGWQRVQPSPQPAG
jgi:hypothetical protein